MKNKGLTGKDRIYLRGLGHHLKPVMQVGKDGVSKEFVANLEEILERHELVKVRVLENAPEGRKAVARRIEAATGCAVVQIIGKVILLYRPSREDPRIELPSR